MNENINRAGRFRFSTKLIESLSYNVLIDIMKNFIIIKCDYIFHGKYIEYIAISHLFDEIEKGAVTPEYTIMITQEKNRKHSVSVQRKK